MKNLEIRMEIQRNRFRHYEVARQIGISEYTLSVWLRTELSEKRKNKVHEAIEKLKEGAANGR